MDRRSNALPSGQNSSPRPNTCLKVPLHLDDAGADREPGAELVLEVGAGREMVGVRVGLEDPLRVELFSCTCAIRASANRVAVRPDFGS
jgi:hypothetical protein